MKKFIVNNEYEIICEWKKTRIAFKHEATLLKNGYEIDKVKICYLNRTWERFEFESVLSKLLHKTKILSDEQIKAFLDNQGLLNEQELNKKMGIIGAFAKIGDVIGKNTKEKNDFKTMIIKKGLGDKGLIMPDDWDTLSEADKEARLNKVIEILNN